MSSLDCHIFRYRDDFYQLPINKWSMLVRSTNKVYAHLWQDACYFATDPLLLCGTREDRLRFFSQALLRASSRNWSDILAKQLLQLDHYIQELTRETAIAELSDNASIISHVYQAFSVIFSDYRGFFSQIQRALSHSYDEPW